MEERSRSLQRSGFISVAGRAMGLAVIAASGTLQAQLTTGTVEGIINDGSGHPQPGITVTARGTPARLVWSTRSDCRGGFRLVLPGGEFELRADQGMLIRLHVFPLHVSHVVISLGKHVERNGPCLKAAAACSNCWDMWARASPKLD